MPQNSPSQRRRKSQTPSPAANGPTRSNPLARRPGQRPSEAQPAPAHSQHRSQTSPPSRTRRKPPVRRHRRFHLPPLLAVLIALVLLPPLLALGINFWMFLTTTGNMTTPEELADQNADCIVVLGAGIEPDGTPSPILAERLDTAITLYENGASEQIIVSGGEDAAQSEVSAMRNYLLDAGIPAMAIITDTHGVDTFASVRNLQDIYHVQNAILVSQRFHLYRAVYIAEHFDLTVFGCPASEENISDRSLLTREFFARIKDYAQAHFGMLPSSLSNVGSAVFHP